MIASFILSRTLVPTMAAYLAARAGRGAQGAGRAARAASAGSKSGFEQRFDRFRDRYQRAAGQGGRAARPIRRRVPCGSIRARWACWCPGSGGDFFPGIKSGEIDMHFRAPIGLRLEEAGKVAALVDTGVARRRCRAMSPTSSTIAACRSAASTRPTARAPRSDRKTAT